MKRLTMKIFKTLLPAIALLMTFVAISNTEAKAQICNSFANISGYIANGNTRKRIEVSGIVVSLQEERPSGGTYTTTTDAEGNYQIFVADSRKIFWNGRLRF